MTKSHWFFDSLVHNQLHHLYAEWKVHHVPLKTYDNVSPTWSLTTIEQYRKNQEFLIEMTQQTISYNDEAVKKKSWACISWMSRFTTNKTQETISTVLPKQASGFCHPGVHFSDLFWAFGTTLYLYNWGRRWKSAANTPVYQEVTDQFRYAFYWIFNYFFCAVKKCLPAPDTAMIHSLT